MSSPNIIATTREWWDKTVEEECWMTVLLTNLLIQRKQVKFQAGTAYKMTVELATMESLAQAYDANDGLNAGANNLFVNPQWTRKYTQIPVKLTEEERDEQEGGGEAVLQSLPERMVTNGHNSMRQVLNSYIYGVGTDGGKPFQGIRSALTHDQTYGGLTRATTVTNELWQGASIGKTFADQATARSANIYYVRACIDAAMRVNNPKPGDLLCITSNEIWRSLQRQVDPSINTKPGSAVKYGFQSLDVDGTEVIRDPWLSHNADAATTKAYFFVLHMPDWQLLLQPSKGFGHMTNFFDQSQISGGLPYELARIKIAGNLICKAPNRSLFLSAMS